MSDFEDRARELIARHADARKVDVTIIRSFEDDNIWYVFAVIFDITLEETKKTFYDLMYYGDEKMCHLDVYTKTGKTTKLNMA